MTIPGCTAVKYNCKCTLKTLWKACTTIYGIVFSSHNYIYEERERHIWVLLLKLSLKRKQLWPQDIFSDLFIWTLSDLPLAEIFFAKLWKLALIPHVKLWAVLSHLFPSDINQEKEQPPQSHLHLIWLSCFNTDSHASAWRALTTLAFLHNPLFARSLIRFYNTQFLEKALPRWITLQISCSFPIWTFPSFLLKPFPWEHKLFKFFLKFNKTQ